MTNFLQVTSFDPLTITSNTPGIQGPAGAQGPAGPAGTGGSGAGLPANVITATGNYTANAGDLVLADTTTGGLAVALPLNPAIGALVAVKKISADTNTLTITASGGGTIDGSSTALTVTRWAGEVLEHTGSNAWLVVGSMSTTGPAGANGTNGTNGTNGAISVIQDEGSALTVRPTLDFVGAGVTATDDAGNNRTLVTIPGGGGGGGGGLIPRALISGRYHATPGSVTSLTLTLGQEWAIPFEVYASTSFTAIGLNVLTPQASAQIRLGVRADSSGLPGSVAFDAGSYIDASTSGTKEVAITQTLAAGIYWLVARATGSASGPTISGTQTAPVMIASTSQGGTMANDCSGYASTTTGTSGAISGAWGSGAGDHQVVAPRIVMKVA